MSACLIYSGVINLRLYGAHLWTEMAELDTVDSKMKSTVDKLMDSNLSIHVKRNILQNGEVCKRVLFTLLDAHIPLTMS